MGKIQLGVFGLVLLSGISLLSACAENPTSPEAVRCHNLLDTGFNYADNVKGQHLSDAADIITATSLLSAASTQREFSRYPGCIDKAQRAIALLKPYVK